MSSVSDRTGAPARARGPHALRALRHRNYRLLLCSQLVSLLGTWMATTTTTWVAFRLSGSALVLGVVAFAAQAPVFALAPIVGFVVDHFDQRRLVIATQTVLFASTCALGVLTATRMVTVPILLAISLAQGIVNAIDMPARSALVLSVIDDRSDVASAVALNGIAMNGARMIGAALAGAVIAVAGEAWSYATDAISYTVPIVALMQLQLARGATVGAATSRHSWRGFVDGWREVRNSAPTRWLVTLLVIMTCCGVAYTVLLPLFAADVLGGGPRVLGLLVASSACGALAASVVLASLRSEWNLPYIISSAAAVYGVGMIAFAASRVLWMSLVITAASGFGSMLQIGCCNTALQTMARPAIRGRVLSCFFMATVGLAPLGSLLAGAISKSIGAPATLVIGGVGCLCGAAWFSTRAARVRASLASAFV